MSGGALRRKRAGPAVGIAVVLAACGAGADPAPVARVGDWVLTQERLADLLVLAQPLPLDSGSVGALVDQWVSMAALAQRTAAGTDLNGPEATEASLWLERREALLDAERRARLGEAVRISPEQARAEFHADTLRLLAHVLRRAGAFTSDAERDLQRRTAQGILDDLVAGGSWAAAVDRSEDVETRTSSGLLGLLRVDELPSRLREAAARLEPGQVSSVVESPQGYHILYRPRFEEVAELYPRLLADRRLEAADAEADRRVGDSLGVRIAAGGAGWVRALARGSGERAVLREPPAGWDGGALGVDVVARHVLALPDDARARLGGASDDAAVAFLERLAVRQARLEGAVRGGIAADGGALDDLTGMHRADVEAWRAALSDGATPFSRQAVDRYMERLVARRISLRPVPALLRRWLLEPLVWGVDATARDNAAASARRLISAAARREGS